MAVRIGIVELAEQIGRQPHTIRQWERDGRLPKKLIPGRDSRQRRYWTQNQADEIKKWMVRADMRPGKGLEHYNPTPEDVERHLQHLREAMSRRSVKTEDERTPEDEHEAISEEAAA